MPRDIQTSIFRKICTVDHNSKLSGRNFQYQNFYFITVHKIKI
jgi:hypothetical protein